MDDVKYNAGARALHWLIALLIIANLASGLLNEALEKTIELMPTHKAIGMTVLVLSLVRLVWRLTWTAPAYPASLSGFEVMAAKAVHVLLYIFMIGMPLSGWIFVSPGKYPLNWFGLFDIAKLPVVKDSLLAGIGHEFHEIGGWLMLALVIGHAGAALRHHFVLKDGVMRRMM